VPEHSLILSTRAPIGSVAITASEACTNQGCKALVTTNKNLSLFLYYQLSSLTEQLNNIGRGSTFLELSTDDLGSFKLSIPDSDIEKIVSYLRNKTTKIDTLIQKQRQQIDLLKERRTALISAAVTGKIDLRDWMPPASSTEASPATEEATA
jgi:type I restriction enzyme S subunit